MSNQLDPLTEMILIKEGVVSDISYMTKCSNGCNKLISLWKNKYVDKTVGGLADLAKQLFSTRGKLNSLCQSKCTIMWYGTKLAKAKKDNDKESIQKHTHTIQKFTVKYKAAKQKLMDKANKLKAEGKKEEAQFIMKYISKIEAYK